MLAIEEWAAERLGYRFRDPALLDAALTHRSAATANYERLEFLGDAVLNFAVADLVFRAFPEAPEGDLSRYRSALVSGRFLAEAAVRLGLGDQLRLGSGELKSGGFRRSSILADALEAVFGAIFLDGGIEPARTVIEGLMSGQLERLPEAAALKDSKTRLQEILQARGLALPAYSVDDVTGEPHEQWFVASCAVAELGLRTAGEGSSRRRAEQAAAGLMLERIVADEDLR